MTRIETIDLNFENTPAVIAVYLIRHSNGAVIIDTGPGSTIPALEMGLRGLGLAPRQVTDVLLTHIHLDHAGASWWLAGQGARIHVHPVGAPHLVNPEKLLMSAKRIYQDDMERLWGAFHPVAERQLVVEQNNAQIEIGGLKFVALDSPGHAEHHFAYLFDNVLFCGDIGGVRLAGMKHVWLPTPPPECQLEKWRASVERLQALAPDYLAPTHFGIANERDWHLDSLLKAIDEIEDWLPRAMADNPTEQVFRERIRELYIARGRADGLDDAGLHTYQTAASSWMAADGLYRYWNKYRKEQAGAMHRK